MTAISVPSGSTLGDALRFSGLLQRHPELQAEGLHAGIWGRLRPLEAVLCEDDRVEVYRPLQVDPMEARRRRQRTQSGRRGLKGGNKAGKKGRQTPPGP